MFIQTKRGKSTKDAFTQAFKWKNYSLFDEYRFGVLFAQEYDSLHIKHPIRTSARAWEVACMTV